MEPQSRPHQRARSAAGFAWLLASVLFAVVRLVPWSPRPVGIGLDESWGWATHEAWQRGLQQGTEFVLTTGPLGFVATQLFVPSTFGVMLAVHLVLASVLGLSLWWILASFVRSPWARFAWGVLLVESMCIHPTLFLQLPVALIAGHWSWGVRRVAPSGRRLSDFVESPPPALAEHVLAACLGMCGLVRLTYLGFGLIAVAAVSADRLLRERRLPALPVTFVASWLLGWLFAGQSLAGLPSYFRHSLEIVSGYGAGVGLAGPAVELPLYVAAAACLIACWGFAWRGFAWRSDGEERVDAPAPNTWLRVAALAVLLFGVFKLAFVRHDAHAMNAAAFLMPWALLEVARATSSPASARPQRLLAVAGLVGTMAFSSVVIDHHRHSSLARLVWANVSGWPAQLKAVGRAFDADALRRAHAAEIARLVRRTPLPAGLGTVDVYPVAAGVVLAHGLSYRPRPVHHSFSAYTSRLARLNAMHLSSPRAPQHILFEVGSVNQLLVSLVDGLSWPELLTRYEVRRDVAARRYLVLERSPRPGSYRMTPILERHFALGEEVELPAEALDDPLWAAIEIRPSWRGRLAALALRAPSVSLTLTMHGGQTRTRRIVPSLAAAGFLLSPLIERTPDYARLATSGMQELHDKQVAAIRVGGANDRDISWAFDSRLELRLWALEIEPPGAGLDRVVP